jgi:hypothetical protein
MLEVKGTYCVTYFSGDQECQVTILADSFAEAESKVHKHDPKAEIMGIVFNGPIGV